MDINPIKRKIEFIEERNPYLTNRVLSVYMEAESDETFLSRVEEYLAEGGIRGLHAAQVLTDYWISLEDLQQAVRVRSIMRDAAEDRETGA